MCLILCIISWLSCLGVLAYQGVVWLFSTWQPLTLADVSSSLFDYDSLSMLSNLPLEWAVKLAYIFMTTELALALWWLGLFFCLLSFTLKLIRG